MKDDFYISEMFQINLQFQKVVENIVTFHIDFRMASNSKCKLNMPDFVCAICRSKFVSNHASPHQQSGRRDREAAVEHIQN